MSSEEGFLGDAEVDQFYFFIFLVIEDILGLQIPVANIPVVEIGQGSHYLPNYCGQLLLAVDGCICQAGEGEVLHDQVGHPLGVVEVEGLVVAYGWVLQFPHYQEGPLYLEYVLLLDYKLLHCIGVVVSLVPALKNAAISSLPQFL